MAIAHVQSDNNDANSDDVSLTLTLTAGNTVIVTTSSWGKTTGSVSVGGQSADWIYGPFSVDGSSFYNIIQWVVYSVTGGSTEITYHGGTGATIVAMIVNEFSGLAADGLDRTQHQDNPTNVTVLLAGTTSTTTQADELILAAFYSQVGQYFSAAGDTYAIPADGVTEVPSVGDTLGTEYKIVAATGAYSADITLIAESVGHGIITTWKAAGAAPAEGGWLRYRK